MSAVESVLPMASRRTALAPVAPMFAEELYRCAVRGDIPWHWHGMSETPESFSESLWSGVLVQYSIQDRRSGRDIGLISAYNANVYHRFAYVTLLLMPEFRMRVWPLEGALLFANYLFVKYDMRNLYAESAEPYFHQFGTGDGSFFDVEAHYRDRLLVNGEGQDMYVLRISRDRWLDRGVELLERCRPPVGAS